MIANPLTEKEFSAALKRGHGRALMHVQQYGLGNFDSILLDACLHNPLYDSQCESSRARWLLNMFKESDQYARFSSVILSALTDVPEDGDDLAHLCDLAMYMAKSGDTDAGHALRAKVLGQSFQTGDPFGLDELVSRDGLDAVVELVLRYSQQGTQDGEAYVFDRLNSLMDREDIIPQTKAALQALAEKNDAVNGFFG